MLGFWKFSAVCEIDCWCHLHTLRLFFFLAEESSKFKVISTNMCWLSWNSSGIISGIIITFTLIFTVFFVVSGNPCETSPCQNGGYCQTIIDPVSYLCHCSNQYRGEHCESRYHYYSITNEKPIGTFLSYSPKNRYPHPNKQGNKKIK